MNTHLGAVNTDTVFHGDLVIVVRDFLGRRGEVGIFDIFLKGERAKCYAVREGKLYFPSPDGDVCMGGIAFLCNSTGVWDERVTTLCRNRKVTLIPARMSTEQ